MSFRLGFILGLAIAGAYVFLVAPTRNKEPATMADLAREEFEEEERRERDPRLFLRRALAAINEQIEMALAEARQAAQEAEKEMRARYQESRRRGRRRR